MADSKQMTGPVLFAYDGCDLAKFSIEQAARELAPGREAIVVTVWQPADVGFVLPAGGQHLDALNAADVGSAAEKVAAEGAAIANQAGFHATALTVEAAPTWKGIVQVAEDRGASLIVLGAHCHSGLLDHLLGNVSSSVVTNAPVSVLVVHPAA